MINFVKSGDNLTLVAPYDVLSGGGFKVGNLFGVAANDALSGTNVECEVDGVYDFAKDPAPLRRAIWPTGTTPRRR
jgi:predicted RecA/RadA family phage recombinase